MQQPPPGADGGAGRAPNLCLGLAAGPGRVALNLDSVDAKVSIGIASIFV